ncbi:hypothetical protein M2271_003992 [Streptomyces sp. LBL]|nr:hypothetical protein [Streptomyces sp. LBL]
MDAMPKRRCNTVPLASARATFMRRPANRDCSQSSTGLAACTSRPSRSMSSR